MKRSLSLAFAATALLAAASGARANMLINGSLESAIPPKHPDNLVYVTPHTHTTALTGWTLDSGTVDIVPNTYFQSFAGNFSVDLVGTPGLGSISQQVATIDGDQYTLTFEFAVNPENGPTHEKNDVKDLRVEALTGSTILSTQDFTGTAGTRTKTNMQYIQETFSFTATSDLTTLRLLAVLPANRKPGAKLYTGPVIDDLDLELSGGGPNVPEPASMSLLGAGATALLLRRSRRK